MLGDVINGVIAPIFDATWSSLEVQYHGGLQDTELKQEHIKAERAIDLASKNYHQRYLERHCSIKVLLYFLKKEIETETVWKQRAEVDFLRDLQK